MGFIDDLMSVAVEFGDLFLREFGVGMKPKIINELAEIVFGADQIADAAGIAVVAAEFRRGAAVRNGEDATDEAAAPEGLADVELYLVLGPAVAAHAQAVKLVTDTAFTTTTATPTTATTTVTAHTTASLAAIPVTRPLLTPLELIAVNRSHGLVRVVMSE